MGVGMPETLLLHEFGSQVWHAFGEGPYHVGSSLNNKSYRDVDVRLILTDEQYEQMELGNPKFPHSNGKWVALCLAFSALGKWMTGLPIDFQIQQMTAANDDYPHDATSSRNNRSFLGRVPLRISKDDPTRGQIYRLEPCPSCGETEKLKFRSLFDDPGNVNWLECEACGQTSSHKRTNLEVIESWNWFSIESRKNYKPPYGKDANAVHAEGTK